MFKASLIQGEDAHEDSDESWESIEEDFPMIGVDELVDTNFEIQKPTTPGDLLSDDEDDLDLEKTLG